MEKHLLSKSTFIRSTQCLKSLWLYKNAYNLRTEPDEAQQAIFSRGQDIGELTQALFPGGVNCAPSTPFDYTKSVIATQQAIASGAKVIYEAAFQFEQVMAALDILVEDGEKYRAYEVKGVNNLTDTHLLDAALQYYVITKSGLHLEDISLVHLNKEYMRRGELELNKLFKITSVLEQVKKLQPLIEERIAIAKDTLKLQAVPNLSIGKHCNSPYLCDFKEHCWAHVPNFNVFDLANDRSGHAMDLYKSGVLKMTDIPDGYPLSDGQLMQVEALKTGKVYIDKTGIKSFLATLSYPLYFMDFESYNPAVPKYNSSRPFQQICFQYSLHVLNKPGGTLTHHEFLAEAGPDPRKAFIEQLLKDLGTTATILVYYQGFEIPRLKEIARDFPEYAKAIDKVITRIVDLIVPFKKRYYYTGGMNGSASIKDVLPALVPELSYGDLEIGEGGAAMAAFESLIGEQDKSKIEKTRKALLTYCKMDTYAMTKLLEKLTEVAK